MQSHFDSLVQAHRREATIPGRPAVGFEHGLAISGIRRESEVVYTRGRTLIDAICQRVNDASSMFDYGRELSKSMAPDRYVPSLANLGCDALMSLGTHLDRHWEKRIIVRGGVTAVRYRGYPFFLFLRKMDQQPKRIAPDCFVFSCANSDKWLAPVGAYTVKRGTTIDREAVHVVEPIDQDELLDRIAFAAAAI